VAVASERNVPLIENDSQAETHYGASDGVSLKIFDSEDIVLQLGTLAPTLGARHGLGWILSGRLHQRLIERSFFADPDNGNAALQRSIARYLGQRGYDRHLRALRETLSNRM
jgi:DNA-binding transcriptional MocR family regulator